MLQPAVFLTLFLAITANGIGELTILHHPSSLSFKGHDHLRQSTLTEVFSASLGFSTQHFSNWNGLYIEDPFTLARAVGVVVVDGVAEMDYGKGHQFPLKNDEDERAVYEELRHRVEERYQEVEGAVVRVELQQGGATSELKNLNLPKEHIIKGSTFSLKSSIEEDNSFLQEISLLNAISESIEKNFPQNSQTPNVIWLTLSSLRPLIDFYGENSTKVNDAKVLLKNSLQELNKSLQKAYNGQVLFTVINNGVEHARKSRSILQATPAPKPDNDLNLAKIYSPDYPVIFNIILWFGVAMVFSLLAICIAIATMDPGRDSIIYRMTSTRLKKD